MPSCFVRSTPCFLYEKENRINNPRCATESLLRAGVLYRILGRESELALDSLHSIVCHIQIIDVETLLYSTAIARPKTIRRIQTSVLRAFEALFRLRTEKKIDLQVNEITVSVHLVIGISWYFIKNEIHSSCEIEDFVETHLCKLCDTPIARITSCVSSLRI